MWLDRGYPCFIIGSAACFWSLLPQTETTCFISLVPKKEKPALKGSLIPLLLYHHKCRDRRNLKVWQSVTISASSYPKLFQIVAFVSGEST